MKLIFSNSLLVCVTIKPEVTDTEMCHYMMKK